MSDKSDAVKARSGGGVRPYWVLVALVLGLGIGAVMAALGDGLREPALQASGMIGGLWLNALKMTVIPLIIALLVTGVAQGAEAARAGRIAGNTVLWIVIVCTSSAVFGALMIRFLTGMFPLPEQAAEALRTGLGGIDSTALSAPVPSIADFFRNIVPDNVVAAASNGDVLPLVIFSLLFALAVGQLPRQGRETLVAFFKAIADTLLIIIDWVLWIAPIGVFALAFSVGASAGGAAFAGLIHYIVLISVIGILVTLAGYPLARLAGGVGMGTFARAMVAPQSVAISTRSSLATLPAMLTAALSMNMREEVVDVTLPMSVALFRATGPAMNVAVAFYVAYWLGLEPTLTQMIAATAVAAIISYGAVSLPGEVSFISSIAPIAMALGVPIAPLALLVAVEMVPDIFRTVGNVTLDVAVTTAVNRATGGKESSGSASG